MQKVNKQNYMQKQLSNMSTLFLLIMFTSLTVVFSAEEKNPFTPKAFAIRYWDKAIRNSTLPKSDFLLSKASPLNAVQTTSFAKLAATNTLSTRLPEFCSAAHLLCFQDEVSNSLVKHTKDVHFSIYDDKKDFANYGAARPGGTDSFKNYSDGVSANSANEFRQYSGNAAGHNDKFTSYGNDGNIDQSFHTYGTAAAGGAGDFKRYISDRNVPDLRFTTYSTGAVGRDQKFSAYGEDGNAGDQRFSTYGSTAHRAKNDFTNYGTNSNVLESDFKNYAEKGVSPNDTFTNYGVNMNVPTQTFKNYARGSVAAHESFANYREKSNVGDDSFESYGKESRGGAHLDFKNYGKSFNTGSDTFKGYAKGADLNHKVGFTTYGPNTTFKDYDKHGVSFAGYTNDSESVVGTKVDGNLVKRWVEPGKFFREKMLNEGTVMPMPDIRDTMPQRSFLPRSILSKMPFSSSKVAELKSIFKVADNSSMEKTITDSLSECERAPSSGETKRCVGSIEDMIDFATSVLGRNVVVRSTENVNGSKSDVMVGRVKGINGGKVTQSVSCHQSLFPYLLYYCHSVPKVRIYEADLLDPKSKAKINHGVAICHLDTSVWSPTHGAFLALGWAPIIINCVFKLREAMTADKSSNDLLYFGFVIYAV